MLDWVTGDPNAKCMHSNGRRFQTAIAVTVTAPAKDVVNNGRCCVDCSSSCCDKGRSCSDGRCCSEAVLFVATAVAPAPDDWLSGSGRLVVIRKSLLNVNKPI